MALPNALNRLPRNAFASVMGLTHNLMRNIRVRDEAPIPVVCRYPDPAPS